MWSIPVKNDTIAKRTFAMALATALGLSAAGALVTDARASSVQYGRNLIVNGDAEAEAGAPDNDHIVKPSGWITTGEFTVVKYGADGGFPGASSVGPKDRGLNLFEGGNVETSTAKQAISLAPYAADLDAGAVRYDLSGWLGGYSDQEDSATVAVSFLSADGRALATVAIGPVTGAQRHGATESVERHQTGLVPKGARSAMVTIVINRDAGTYNDGSVDDLSFVLTKSPSP